MERKSIFNEKDIFIHPFIFHLVAGVSTMSWYINGGNLLFSNAIGDYPDVFVFTGHLIMYCFFIELFLTFFIVWTAAINKYLTPLE